MDTPITTNAPHSSKHQSILHTPKRTLSIPIRSFRRSGARRLNLLVAAVLVTGLVVAGRAAPVAAATAFSVNLTTELTDINPGDGHCDGVSDVAQPGDQCTLRAAVMEANALPNTNIIVLPAGTYPLAILGTDEDAAKKGDLDITGDLILEGAGANKSIIDAKAIDRAFHIMPGAFVYISDVTIQNGMTNNVGGGIANKGSLGLEGSVVTSNHSDLGGGIFNDEGATLALVDSSVTGNTDIATAGSSPGYGGGIANLSTLSLQRSMVTSNSSDRGGGILSLFPATASLVDSTVSGNTSTSSGGGVRNSGELVLARSTVSGNSAENGGGIYHSNGLLRLSNSTVSGNTSTLSGGGINVDGSELELRSVTITGNTADADGDGTGDGGGMAVTSSPPPSVANTILAGNNDKGGQAPECAGTFTSLGYNLIHKVAGCTILGDMATNKVGVAASLRSLQFNGGSTMTHALLGDSPAIDSGNLSTVGSGNATCLADDQRGFKRPVDGNVDGSARCDIGAYEYNGPVITGITPAATMVGSGAFTLQVTGKNFATSSVVYWKGTKRVTKFVNSTTLMAQITADDAKLAQTVTVRVLTPGAVPSSGYSNVKQFTVTNPKPAITSLNPQSIKTGNTGFTLLVNGTGFVSDSQVRWNGKARTTAFVSATQLKVSIPASDRLKAGTAQVTVVNAAPGGGSSAAKPFTITP